jgi:hypothetical protein
MVHCYIKWISALVFTDELLTMPRAQAKLHIAVGFLGFHRARPTSEIVARKRGDGKWERRR